jgi:anti-sigma regulatory factor (Ser/Thr protein kinase)
VPEASLELPSKPASVGVARRWLAENFEAWDLPGMDYDVSVVLSELVTNAILHARTQVVVRLSYDGSVVRLEVEDGSPDAPVARRPSARATTGRGMLLVGSLSTGWGCSLTRGGKVVWAEFDGVDSANDTDGNLRRLDRHHPAPRTGRSSRGRGGSVANTLRARAVA